jgi:maltose O-acetyltransferase
MTIKDKIFHEFKDWFELIFIRSLPNGFVGNRIRRLYWGSRVKSIGKNIIIARMAVVEVPELVTIGDNVAIGEYGVINPGGSLGVYIGNNVLLAQGLFIRAANHEYRDPTIPIRDQGYKFSSIDHNGSKYSVVIEDDVWCGVNVVILSGAKIGKGSIISANSVVSKDIPPYSVVMGNPGVIIFNRKDKYEKKIIDSTVI